MYNHATDACGFSCERKKQEGYWFWQEFIAEAISNHVSYVQRSSGSHYHLELIDWEVNVWGGIPEQLCNLLDDTFFYYPSTLDEYALAHYYTKLLTDDFTCCM